MTYTPKREAESNPLRDNEILMTVTIVKCKRTAVNARTTYHVYLRVSYKQRPQSSINEPETDRFDINPFDIS